MTRRRRLAEASPRRGGPSPATLLGLLALGTVLAMVQACTRTDIVSVEIVAVSIEPASAAIVAGESTTLTARVVDQEGNRVPSSAVTWSTDSPSVVAVDDAGTVLGLAAGTAVVRAAKGEATGTADITVLSAPLLRARPPAVELTAPLGGPGPDPVAVEITNAGAGTLESLEAAVEYPAGAEDGWLTPGLDDASTPTVLRLVPATSALPEGVHRATVRVSAPGASNSPLELPVEVAVADERPILRLTPSAVGFAAVEGGGSPADQVVEVTNVGGGSISGLSAAVEDTGAGTAWLSAALAGDDAPTELVVSVDPTGLTPGVYEGAIRVTAPSATNSPRTVAVSLSVETGPEADLSVEQTGPDGVVAGDTLALTVEVRNRGPGRAHGTTVIDSLPPALDVIGLSANGTRSGGVVRWELGTLDDGESRITTVTAVARDPGTWVSRAHVWSDATDPVASDDRDGHAVEVRLPEADLAVTKTGPARAERGDTIEYRLGIRNQGPDAADEVVLVDSLPAGLTVLTTSGNGSRTEAGIRWTRRTLAAGEVLEETVRVRVDQAGSLFNVGHVSANTGDPDPSDDRSVAVTAVDRLADLEVEVDGPSEATAGDTLTYVVTVENSGPDGALGVEIVDSLPRGATLVEAGDGGTLDGGAVTWPTIDRLEPGAVVVRRVEVALSPEETGTLASRARVSAATEDPDAGNDRAVQQTDVEPGASVEADLAVVADGPVEAPPGSTLTWVVTVTNQGPAEARGVVVTDSLPADVTLVSASDGGQGGEGDSAVRWGPVDRLAPSASLRYRVEVRVEDTAGGSLTHVARVEAISPDPVPDNDRATHTTSVVEATADLAVEKTAPATAEVEDEIVHTIRVVNRGPGTATGVVVTDHLPKHLEFDEASDGGTLVNGIVTWPAVETLAAGASFVRTVTVEVGSPGRHVNEARVASVTLDPDDSNDVDTASTRATPEDDDDDDDDEDDDDDDDDDGGG